MSKNIKGRVLSGMMWTFAEKMGSQGISFIVSVVLARLLMPSQYGLIAMLSVVMAICNTFIDCGFGVALVQKKNSDEKDFNTVLYSSTFVGFVLYIIMYFSAPLVSSFFNQEELTKVMRIYTLSFLWSGYNSVLVSYISKHMLFKKMFRRTLIANSLSGVAGITAAYMGFGFWALVIQNFTAAIIGIITLQLSIDWIPKLQFSWSRAKKLLSFSSKVMTANLIGTGFNELKGLLIGRLYTPADLAFYNKGGSLPSLVANNINTSIGNVLFPAMSQYSDNRDKVKEITSRSIRISSYVLFFGLTILILISEPLVRLLFTEKWVACVPYMQMVCLQRMLEIISTANLQAMKAVGEGNVIVKLELYKKPIFLLLTVIGANISVFALAVTLPLYSFIANIINMWPNIKILNYRLHDQVRDLAPSTILSIIMAIVLFPVNFLPMSDILKIVSITIFGVIIYIGVSIIAKVESLNYIFNTIKTYRNKKR